MHTRKTIIAVDFDGTLCEHKYPDIGPPHTNIITRLKQMKAAGFALILWTCREGKDLEDAIEWCKGFGLEFDRVNEGPYPDMPDTTACGRKIYADYYLDDRNITIWQFLNDPEVWYEKE